jgi:3-oxoacyl-[acyl-carrier protein] reductase
MSSSVPQRFTGRVALVTGAGSGIGRASARRLAAEGARVVVTDLNLAAAQETAEPLGGAAIACQLDVTDEAALRDVVGEAVALFGALHAVHANAGVPQPVAPIEELTAEAFRHVVDVNLIGPYLTTRAVVGELKKTKGAIVVTGSVSSLRTRDGMAAYIASKTGVNGLVRALAFELARYRVRVNAVLPGPVQTPLLRSMAFGDDPDDTVAKAEAGIPLGRLIPPESIAAAAAYLLSDEALDMTGVLLPVDGGRNA